MLHLCPILQTFNLVTWASALHYSNKRLQQAFLFFLFFPSLAAGDLLPFLRLVLYFQRVFTLKNDWCESHITLSLLSNICHSSYCFSLCHHQEMSPLFYLLFEDKLFELQIDIRYCTPPSRAGCFRSFFFSRRLASRCLVLKDNSVATQTFNMPLCFSQSGVYCFGHSLK